MIRKLAVDNFFKIFFLSVSSFSLVALVAIILFVFAQGIIPFVRPTAESVHLIPFGIDRYAVNGKDIRTSDLPRGQKYTKLEDGSGRYRISFPYKKGLAAFQIDINLKENNAADKVKIQSGGSAEITYPEEYIYEIKYKGAIAGKVLGFYVSIPIRPTRPLRDFLLASEWRPTYNKQFGILSMIQATILSTLGAMLLGIPLGLLTAMFLAEFIPRRMGRYVRGAVDLLAGIPSVVYGFFGLMMVVPFIKNVSGAAAGDGLLAAVIILSLMMLPTIISITETSLRAVPRIYREGSLALGATKMQTSWKVVFPAAKSGITAGVMLGISRAVGETMAVIMVAGNSPQFPSKLTDGIRTLTATIALEMGYAQGRHSRILFSVGIVLFSMILILNSVVLILKNRAPEKNNA